MSSDISHEILENGSACHYHTKEPLDYAILRLDMSFLPQMMELQEVVLEDLGHPHMLQPFPEDFMRLHLEEKGFSLGVLTGTRLIAFRNTYFPDRDEPIWNLGPDLNLPTRFLGKLVNLQFSCVDPEFRGNRLGHKMMQHALSIIRAMDNYYFCCATVSPLNPWSVNILLRNGFTIRTLKSKYEGKLRYLVCQNLRKTVKPCPDNVETVNLTDFEKQKKLFSQGLCGIKLQKAADNPPLPRNSPADGYELIFADQSLF